MKVEIIYANLEKQLNKFSKANFIEIISVIYIHNDNQKGME
jgi:hypothetical protein